MYIIATLIATGGIFSFSRIVVTGEKRHRVQERRLAKTDTTSAQPGFFSILKNHRHYAQYQLHQFLAGTANMMLPVTEEVAERILVLPTGSSVDKEMICKITSLLSI